jgi:hypothetical protein
MALNTMLSTLVKNNQPSQMFFLLYVDESVHFIAFG